MFETLFTEHTEYVESEPEYAFRAYISYILDYRRDLKKALHFYMIHKDEMKDEIVRELWESELMMCTNSFNNPDEFVEMSALVNELILENKGTFENKRVNNIYEYGVYGKTIRHKLYASDKKRDAIRKEEILSAVVKSGRSYDEIMNFLNAGSDGEKTEK